jgi:hypothetical protein
MTQHFELLDSELNGPPGGRSSLYWPKTLDKRWGVLYLSVPQSFAGLQNSGDWPVCEILDRQDNKSSISPENAHWLKLPEETKQGEK